LSVFARFLHVFELQYPIMGNALVMTAKVVWDLATYWGVPALLFRNDKLCDVSFMSSVRREVTQFERLSAQMQELFRDWAEVEDSAWHPTLVNVLRAEWLFELQCALTTRFSDDELREKLADNVAGFEALAAALFRKAGRHPPTGLLSGTVSNGAGPAAQLDAILSGDAEAAREWKDRPASVKVASPA
jgi:hypothetical protein